MGDERFETLLVSAEGPGPNSKQRSRIQEFWNQSRRSHPPVALLTNSTAARLVATALSWLLTSAPKCFAFEDLAGALAYLGSPVMEDDVARARLSMHNALRFQRVG